MADLGGGPMNIDGGGIFGSGGGGNGFSGMHLTYTAQLFAEPMRRGEVQTWEGEQDAIVRTFAELAVGAPANNLQFIKSDGEWGTPFIGGVTAPRRMGDTWTMQVTVVQLRKCFLWTLDYAEIQKDIRTWRQDYQTAGGDEPSPDIPDLSKLAQWERAKEVQDYEDYDKYKTVDGKALEDATLELAKMIRRGIESYTIHTPVPTMTMRYYDEIKGTGALLDKYLDTLPSGPGGWKELGGAEIHTQLNDLRSFHTDGSGGVGTVTFKWLCISDKSTSNDDGSCTRVVQFMRVNEVEDKLYSRGSPAEGGLS